MKKTLKNSDMKNIDKDKLLLDMFNKIQDQQKTIDLLVKSTKKTNSLVANIQRIIRTQKSKVHTHDLDLNNIKNVMRKMQ